MKKQTYLRVELCEGATSLCDSIVQLAAKANGGAKISLNDLATVANGERIRYPVLNEGVTVELIGDSLLHIDKKIGDSYMTVCRIEEVELYSVDDIPGELYRQSNGYGALAE